MAIELALMPRSENPASVVSCVGRAAYCHFVQAETRAYFAVYSDVMSSEELASRIGAASTTSATRGSPRREPPVPVANKWALDSGLGRAAPLWQHLEALYERVGPLADAIGALCAGEPTSVLRIVREFTLSDQEADLRVLD